MDRLLLGFLVLRLLQHILEMFLAKLNRDYYSDPARQKDAQRILEISEDDMRKTLAYSKDKFRFAMISEWVGIVVTLAFIALGGLGWAERFANSFAGNFGGGDIVTGLCFFASLGVLSYLTGLPFAYYRIFSIEEKHGFNKQTCKGFVIDQIKGIVLAGVLGGLLLGAVLWVMSRMGDSWWVYAWVLMSGFSLFAAWIYPTLLAPLFNKFTPLPDGGLKDKIYALGKKIGFKTDGIYVMDASRRSSHGNAYFTGVFGKKRIVLFDTLIESIKDDGVVAVLAHELGHFKLHHVRWGLIRGIVMTGVMFYLLGRFLPLSEFYQAFGLSGVTNYGALVVFSLWFGLVDFLLNPINNHISRTHEFAADHFAKEQLGGDATELGNALLKLREKSHAMPLTHPLFSTFYHSHPPLLERLRAMGRV